MPAEQNTRGCAHPVPATPPPPRPVAELHSQPRPTCRMVPALPITSSDPHTKTKTSVSWDKHPLTLGKPGVVTLGLATPTLTVCSRMAGLVSRNPCTT